MYGRGEGIKDDVDSLKGDEETLNGDRDISKALKVNKKC